MSGHSKWSNIHRKKEANDKVRSGIFTKMAAAIVVAVKKGGGITDPDMNFSLRLAVDRARAVSMPKENIDRAIAKGSGKGGSTDYAELTIEGFAPGGVAFIAEVLTDNRNRSVSELRTLIEKHGGRMGEPGSVAYLFDHLGMVSYSGAIDDEQMLTLIDLGVVDSIVGEGEEELSVLYTTPDSLHSVVRAVKELGLEQVDGILGYRGSGGTNSVVVSQLENFMEILRQYPDVQEVYVNLV